MYVVSKHGSSLSSRRTGSVVRKNLIKQFNGTDKVVIDLSNVDNISQSFADEAFAVLVKEFSYNFMLENIKFINANYSVATSISKAILIRVDERN